MASQAHGEPITGSSLTGHGKPILNQKKKNTESEIKPNQPITSLAPGITSRCRWLAERSIPIQKQTKQANTELSKPNTEHRGVYQKKKKIPNTQTKIKPSKPLTHGRSRRRRRCHSEPVVVVVVRLVTPHCRSEIGERRT